VDNPLPKKVEESAHPPLTSPVQKSGPLWGRKSGQSYLSLTLNFSTLDTIKKGPYDQKRYETEKALLSGTLKLLDFKKRCPYMEA